MSSESLLEKSGQFLARLSDSVVSLGTENNILERVPFASFIVQAFSLKESFHLRRLERNCHAFMAALREGDTTELSETLRKIKDDPKLRWEIEDTTLQILIESEKPIKAEILGRLLLAVKDDKLSVAQFDTLSLMLINASVPALYALPRFYEASEGGDAIHGQNLGSFEPLLISMGVAFRNGSKFQMDECGRDLFRYGFLKRVPSNPATRAPSIG
jgi:hypothetical protein